MGIHPGGLALFVPFVSGTVPMNWQWSWNNTPLRDATNQALALANAGQPNVGAYVLYMTNPFGSATSSNAMLTLFAPPTAVTRFCL